MRTSSMIAALPLVAALATTAMAAGSDDASLKTGPAAFGDWQGDEPGARRLIRPEDLPAPYVTESASNAPDTVAMPDGAKPKVPAGFEVDMVASGIRNPRAIRVAPNGDLFVADSRSNEVLVFRVPAGKATPEAHQVFATAGLHQPYGIAFYPPGPTPEWVYVANSNGLVRFPYQNGDLQARGKAEVVVSGIPSVHHWTRDIVFSPDGKQFYFSVGSGSNVAETMAKVPPDGFVAAHPLGATWGSEEGRADVLLFDASGKSRTVYATGLRNCAGMTMQPETNAVWCVVNERDELGDNVPFEYATAVKQGAFYGWPWYYIGGHEDPRHAGERSDLANQVTVPDVLFQAHSAPLNIAFYEGDDFPPDYKGDAFVTFHGSWNRGMRTGYKVVRVRFKDGKPTGEYDDFMTGFVSAGGDVWGRPVGVAVGKDGSLFVSEDANGTIWRVTHKTAGE